MRLGTLLLMLSVTVAVGGYLYLPPPLDDAADLAEVTRISIAPYHRTKTDVRTVRSVAPASRQFREVVKKDDASAMTDGPQAPDVWTTVVRPHRSATAVLRSSKPGDAATRYELARDLQRELKRAGCYGGEINGVWSTGTKRAMAAFLDRANATLPIKTPDFILLSLVQNHNDIACTAECPTGQSMDRAGRCIPSAVIAQQASKQTKEIADAQPNVAAHAPERLPWLDRNGRSLTTAAPPAEQRHAPPPGMMSIGVASTSASATTNDTSFAGASGSVADPNAAKVATLTPDDEASTANAEPGALTDAKPEIRPRHAKRSRGWRDRPRHYRSAGRHRRGDPRPGTMRYNLVQALGGIY
jgi:hypothetical protein